MANKNFEALTKEQISQINNLGKLDTEQVRFGLMSAFLVHNGFVPVYYAVSPYFPFNVADNETTMCMLIQDDVQEDVKDCAMYMTLTSFKLRVVDDTVPEEQQEWLDLSKEWIETLNNAYGDDYLNMATNFIEAQK